MLKCSVALELKNQFVTIGIHDTVDRNRQHNHYHWITFMFFLRPPLHLLPGISRSVIVLMQDMAFCLFPAQISHLLRKTAVMSLMLSFKRSWSEGTPEVRRSFCETMATHSARDMPEPVGMSRPTLDTSNLVFNVRTESFVLHTSLELGNALL